MFGISIGKSHLKKVNFLAAPNLIGVIPKPRPSGKLIPDWFKAIPPYRNSHPKSGTVKTCVPFLDAYRLGYIIPLWADVYVEAKDGNLNINFPENFPQETCLAEHSISQISGHPLSKSQFGSVAIKWINPWVIETPAGYSCLITSPLNHLETRFKILDGVVDTDTYYNQINLPFIWTGGEGHFFIKKGTPLAHVIPIKRDEFSCDFGEIDERRKSNVFSKLQTHLKDGYKTMFWNKRSGRIEDGM